MNGNKQGLKRTLFKRTRHYNIHIFYTKLNCIKLPFMIEITILRLCFCSFHLFCPLLFKDISIENLYVVLSCPNK